MYLISIYFDEKTEKIMQGYINQVAKVTGNTFMLDGNIPPHITVLGFQGKDEQELIEIFDKHIDNIRNIENTKENKLYFGSLGVFKGQVIYAQPVLNEYLHELSQMVYDVFGNVDGIEFSPFYKPFSWLPHMSIGKHLNEKQMEEAFKTLVKNFVPMEAAITRIGVAKTNPHRDIKVYELKRNEQ